MTFVLALLGLPTVAWAAEATPIADRPCPVAVPAGTTCGFLLVPERRDVPRSATIKVAFAVHRTSTPGRKPDPVVYAGGGPGSSALHLVGFLAAMLPDRDVVVIEQRGSGHSVPRLDCPEITRSLLETLKAPGAAATEAASVVTQALACRARLEHGHFDLRGYRTGEIATDIVELRRALGYPRWNLFGMGYATRPMVLAAAKDPLGTRSVVLDSFVPATAKWYDEASEHLATTVDALGISARFAAMTARFDATLPTFATRDPRTGRPVTVRLTGDDAATILAGALRETEVASIAPALVDGLADDHPDLLRPLVTQAARELTSPAWGAYYAIQCQDEVPFNTFAGPGTGPRLSFVAIDSAVCRAWGLPAARDEGAEFADDGSAHALPAQRGQEAQGGQGAQRVQEAQDGQEAQRGQQAQRSPMASNSRVSHAAAGGTSARTASEPPPILVVSGQYDPSMPPNALAGPLRHCRPRTSCSSPGSVTRCSGPASAHVALSAVFSPIRPHRCCPATRDRHPTRSSALATCCSPLRRIG